MDKNIFQNWTQLIIKFILNQSTADLKFLPLLIDSPLPAARKLLVLINPSSGPGKSLEVFREKVEPMLGDADINYKAIVTGLYVTFN